MALYWPPSSKAQCQKGLQKGLENLSDPSLRLPRPSPCHLKPFPSYQSPRCLLRIATLSWAFKNHRPTCCHLQCQNCGESKLESCQWTRCHKLSWSRGSASNCAPCSQCSFTCQLLPRFRQNLWPDCLATTPRISSIPLWCSFSSF